MADLQFDLHALALKAQAFGAEYVTNYPTAHNTMSTTYRVEAHDGKGWGFGIRINPNSHTPEFCDLDAAPTFAIRAEAFKLRDDAARLSGGTLRVARVR